MEIAAALRELPKLSRRAIRTLSKHVAYRAETEDAGGGGYVGDARDVVLPILERQRTRDGSDCVVETVDVLMRVCRSLCSSKGIIEAMEADADTGADSGDNDGDSNGNDDSVKSKRQKSLLFFFRAFSVATRSSAPLDLQLAAAQTLTCFALALSVDFQRLREPETKRRLWLKQTAHAIIAEALQPIVDSVRRNFLLNHFKLALIQLDTYFAIVSAGVKLSDPEWSLVDMVDLLPVPEMVRILVGKLRDYRPILSLCLEILSRLTSAILAGLFPVRDGPKEAIPAGIVGLWERIALIIRTCIRFIPSPDPSDSGKNHEYTLEEQLDTVKTIAERWLEPADASTTWSGTMLSFVMPIALVGRFPEEAIFSWADSVKSTLLQSAAKALVQQSQSTERIEPSFLLLLLRLSSAMNSLAVSSDAMREATPDQIKVTPLQFLLHHMNQKYGSSGITAGARLVEQVNAVGDDIGESAISELFIGLLEYDSSPLKSTSHHKDLLRALQLQDYVSAISSAVEHAAIASQAHEVRLQKILCYFAGLRISCDMDKVTLGQGDLNLVNDFSQKKIGQVLEKCQDKETALSILLCALSNTRESGSAMEFFKETLGKVLSSDLKSIACYLSLLWECIQSSMSGAELTSRENSKLFKFFHSPAFQRVYFRQACNLSADAKASIAERGVSVMQAWIQRGQDQGSFRELSENFQVSFVNKVLCHIQQPSAIKLLTSICPMLVAKRARGLIVSSLLLSLTEAQRLETHSTEKQEIAQNNINIITGHLIVLRTLDLDFWTLPEGANRVSQDSESSRITALRDELLQIADAVVGKWPRGIVGLSAEILGRICDEATLVERMDQCWRLIKDTNFHEDENAVSPASWASLRARLISLLGFYSQTRVERKVLHVKRVVASICEILAVAHASEDVIKSQQGCVQVLATILLDCAKRADVKDPVVVELASVLQYLGSATHHYRHFYSSEVAVGTEVLESTAKSISSSMADDTESLIMSTVKHNTSTAEQTGIGIMNAIISTFSRGSAEQMAFISQKFVPVLCDSMVHISQNTSLLQASMIQGLKVMLSVPSLRGVLHRYYPALWKSSRGLLRGQHSSMLTSLVKSELIKLIIALVVQYSLGPNSSSLEPRSQQNVDRQPDCKQEDMGLELFLPESIALVEDYVRAGEGPEDTLRTSSQFLQSIYSER